MVHKSREKTKIFDEQYEERVRELFANLRREMVPWQGQLGPAPALEKSASDQLPEINMESLPPSEICPFIKTSWDRDIHFSDPHPENRCYKSSKSQPVDLNNQEHLCLTLGYAQCPVYQATPSENQAKTLFTRLRKFIQK